MNSKYKFNPAGLEEAAAETVDLTGMDNRLQINYSPDVGFFTDFHTMSTWSQYSDDDVVTIFAATPHTRYRILERFLFEIQEYGYSYSYNGEDGITIEDLPYYEDEEEE